MPIFSVLLRKKEKNEQKACNLLIAYQYVLKKPTIIGILDIKVRREIILLEIHIEEEYHSLNQEKVGLQKMHIVK
jgi:hypothetical protein